MPVRRATDPLYVQHVWDGIKYSVQQKQLADMGRIVRFVQKGTNCSQQQAELYVKQCLQDELIVEVKKISQKTGLIGNEVDTYRINKQEDLQTPPDDGYDWYCFECHLAGDVTQCRKCYRVFHTECSTNARQKQILFPTKKNHIIVNNGESTSSSSSNSSASNSTVNVNNVIATMNNADTDNNGSSSSTNTTSNGNVVTDNGTEGGGSGSGGDGDGNENPIPKTNDNDNHDAMTIANDTTTNTQPPQAATVDNNQDYIYDESLCSMCNMNDSDPGSGLDLEEFNYLLNFVLRRIKSWVPERLTSTLTLEPKYEWHTQPEMTWRAGQLFYQHMDMSLIEMKIRTKQYANFSQFQADVYTIVHNVAVFHGVESQEFGAAELMIRDMNYDISELQNCVDCYKHSNEKINDRWFCLPCRVPHRLVWAKQKGYPYWPAKVIRETDTSCDVRFFSGKYERSMLPKNSLKPITTSLSQLHIKKTASFNRALEELHLHQKLLENPGELAKVISMVPKKPKKAAPRTPRRSEPYKAQHAAGGGNTLSRSQKRKTLAATDDVYEFHDSPSDYTKAGQDEGRMDRKRKSSFQSDDGIKVKKLPSPSKTPTVPTNIHTPLPPGREQPLQQQHPQHQQQQPNDLVQLTDLDEDNKDGAFRAPNNNEFVDNQQELVTSSTGSELMREDIYSMKDGSDGVMQKLDQPYSDAVEKMRRKLEPCKDKKQLIQIAMDCMQAETDRLINEHNEARKRLFELHNAQISDTKKKQWCYNCEQDAIYHCCWNTAYCSPTCQQQHWLAEHKKVCRRKR